MLDHALMRRMTLKVTFHPLRERDRAAAYERELEQFGGPLGEAERRRLSALEGCVSGTSGTSLGILSSWRLSAVRNP